MNCERTLCIYNTAGRCGNAAMAGAGGIMDVLFEATGRPPGHATGCSECREINPEATLDDCQGECAL